MVNAEGRLIGELTEQDLMVRESGVDAGPYVMLLDSVIYLRNPLNWDKQVHQVLGTKVSDLMRKDSHSCGTDLPLPKAASQLHERGTHHVAPGDHADGTLVAVQHEHCLLYTSPSPRDLSTSRMPSSA